MNLWEKCGKNVLFTWELSFDPEMALLQALVSRKFIARLTQIPQIYKIRLAE